MSALNDLENAFYKRDTGHIIAEGRMYTGFVASESVAAGADLNVVISVGDKVAALLGINLTAVDTAIAFGIYRNPVYTGGTVLPKLNLNDAVGVTGLENTDLINSTVAVSDKGDVVFGPWDLYSENNATITRAITGPLVLKANTDYLVSLTNPSGAAVEMSIAIRYVDQ